MYTCVRPLNMNMYKYSIYIYIHHYHTHSQHTVKHLHLLQAYKHILCVFPTCSIWNCEGFKQIFSLSFHHLPSCAVAPSNSHCGNQSLRCF